MINNMGVISSTIAGLLVFTFAVRGQEIRGTAGVDYPNYQSIPKTSFRCSEQKYIPGFYADLETECQVFHLCLENRQETFLCPPSTTFNQATLTCDYWYSSNCSLAPLLYSVNSGPVMDHARRNIPTLIKLKSIAQNRQSIHPQAANVYEKIASLYEDIADETQFYSAETSDVPEDIKESRPRISHGLEADEMPEGTRKGSKKKDLFPNEDLLSRWDSSSQNDEEHKDAYYSGTSSEEAEGNMEPQILYDPVTEQYFVDYDSSQNEWQRDPEDQVDKFSFYDRYTNTYGLALNDYVDESEIPTESVINDPQGFAEVLDTVEMDENEQFLRRMFDTEQPAKRVRRKPIYTVIPEDDNEEVSIPVVSREVKHLILPDFEDSSPETESTSTDAEASSEEVFTEIVEMEEKSDSDVSSEITDEMRNPNFTPLNTSEVPLTSEEFEHAIITELVLPKIDELDLRMISEEQRDEESSESVSQDFKDGDQSSFVEDATPDDYESYSAEYNGDDTVIEERSVTDQEARDNDEKTNWYQSGETTSEDSVGVDDTYVVIPDESDASVLDQYSETNEGSVSSDGSTNGEESDEQNEINVDYDSYSALRNYFLSNYVSPGAYASVDPYGFQSPGYYFSNEYGSWQPLNREGFLYPENRELLRSPYEYAEDSGATNDQEFPVAFSDGHSPGGYFYPVEPSSYSYEQPTSFADYMYGAENGYPYGNVHGSPYLPEAVRNYGYDTPDLSESARYSDLNENPGAAFVVNRDYSEPEIPSWVQSDLTESSEIGILGVTDSSIPTEDALVDLYDATESSNEDLKDLSVPVETVEDVSIEDAERMKQAETYYLIDFEEDGEEKVEDKLGDAATSQPDAEKLDLEELFQTEKPWQSNESSVGDLRNIDVASEYESTKTEQDDLSTGEDLVSRNVDAEYPDLSESAQNIKSREIPASLSFDTAEGSRVDEKPVTSSSALERLAGLNTVKESKRSDANNLPSDSKSLNRMVFQDSMAFGPYGVNMGQQYGMADAVMAPIPGNAYSHRTGNSKQPRMGKLSAIQERIRSLKQGKFGAFKKYMNSARDQN